MRRALMVLTVSLALSFAGTLWLGRATPPATAQPKAGLGSIPADQKEVVFLGFGGTHEKKYGVKVVMNENLARWTERFNKEIEQR